MTGAKEKQDAALLAAVMDTMLDGLIVIDGKGAIESLNPAALRMFGYTEAEVLGENVKMLMPEPYHTQHDGYLENYRVSGKARIIGIGREVTGRRKDGAVFPMELAVGAMALEGKRMFVGTIHDLTLRAQAEENTALLAAIVESSEDAILSKTLDGTIRSWNAGAERLFGYSAAEAIGKPVGILIPQDLQEEEFILSQLRQGKSIRHYETVRLHKNGRRIDISLTVSPIRNPAGRIIGASKIARDISDRKQAEARLQTYTQELERINKELDTFAYIASHDLKSPLRAIDSLAKWLCDDLESTVDATNRERLGKLRGRVRRMEAMLDDILEYSRAGGAIEAGVPVDARAIIAEVAGVLNVPEGFHIRADASLAGILIPRMPPKQIFHNLISNALKHHHKKTGTITVSARHEGNFIRFEVADDGPGIARKYHDRIFEMFQTLRPRDEVEGSGMGLALVKKIVTRFGGTVAVESSEGNGAAFTFTWPKDALRREEAA